MKKAFTMLELVFVIVVVAILAAVIIPNTRTNPVQEAGIQVLSHIRYTQHLAMLDDRYNTNRIHSITGKVIWHRERWQIVFGQNINSNNRMAYTIFSDTSGNSTGDANELEIAINPENPNERMTGGHTGANALDINHNSFVGMNKLNIGNSYNITSVNFAGGCPVNGSRLSFDYLGRPMHGDQSTMTGPYTAGTQRLITSSCTITLTDGSETAIITIRPETGYASLSFL
ncbi:MAG: type II secretion system protein [Sulfurimonas sp.]|nr:type II secretion system protein [Sulfurimonas sp.]MBU3938297.1 type II secretion system GspH family protein [bacterium]MBU4023639.1 type II secretion system GspH family protein [bacterium]MBU4059359.1 type II secretion system GspH family protein [bacterium]MBU4111110.1 type II secretion system GspH family protein [bacterium]